MLKHYHVFWQQNCFRARSEFCEMFDVEKAYLFQKRSFVLCLFELLHTVLKLLVELLHSNIRMQNLED